MSGAWIAYRLALLGADSRGVVRGGLTVRDHAVRAALLIDLTQQGRLSGGVDDSYLDTTPIGFPAADALLRYVDANPTRTMAHALGSAPVTVLDVVDPLPEGTARRPRRRRAVTVDVGVVERERQLVDETAERGRSDSPATAALTVIAGALELTSDDTRAALLPWCGASRGLVEQCATYLVDLMVKQRLIHASYSTGGGGG